MTSENHSQASTPSMDNSASSVYQAFIASCTSWADRSFLHIPATATKSYASSAIDFTYGEAAAQVESRVNAYRAKGYRSPLRVGLLLENRADFFFHWLALNSLGCSVIPLHPDMPTQEMGYFLEHGEAALAVALPEAVGRLQSACAELASPPAIVASDNLEDLPQAPNTEEATIINGATECALLYTSGSTGRPKACILNNDYFLFSGHWYNTIGGMVEVIPGQERLLTPLPLNHMNAMACSTMAMIMSGGCIVQLDRFHPRSWWQSVRDSGATIVHYLGVLPAILLEMPAAPTDDFRGQIKFGFGAGVNPKHHAVFEQRFGFPLLEAWAMTESGTGGSIIANSEPRYVGTSCFGKPEDWLEIQLVDERKQEVAHGQDGELRVRARGENPAKGFFSGYLKNPEATAEAWQDGWLNTGDVVRENPDGTLSFVDRRKNVIRRSGENISALEVEAALASAPGVSELIAAAVPDDIRGDEVAVCVVLKPDHKADESSANLIVEHSLENLAYFKCPGYVVFCDELPKTASNKPKRADVKALARARVASGDCVDTRHLKKRRKTA
jgi:acyl-CoA synthetase (AMP-forming)/AMP-acid ligase II